MLQNWRSGREQNYNRFGIPNRYIQPPLEYKITKDNEEVSLILRDVIDRFSENRPPQIGLFLYGTSGTGKTTILSEIAKAAANLVEDSINNSRPAEMGWDDINNRPKRIEAIEPLKGRFQSYRDFLEDVRKSWENKTNSIKELVNENDFIFIDDIKLRKDSPRESLSNYAWDATNELIDRLDYEAEGSKLLYMTTNLTLEQLSETFGDWFIDRVGQLCMIKELNGASFR